MDVSQIQLPGPPRVGVGVLVVRDGRVLLGLRRGSHGSGTWSPPGGHLEYGEDPVACVRREALEEAGIDLGDCQFVGITNDIFEAEARHYLTLFYMSAWTGGGEPRVREPLKCEAWQWWSWHDLPDNLFLPLRHLREQGFSPAGISAVSTSGESRVATPGVSAVSTSGESRVATPGVSEVPTPGRLRRVCVFCGSRSGRQPAYPEQAAAFGRLLAAERLDLVYGGRGAGLMGAVADAVRSDGGRVIGVIPRALVRVEAAVHELDDLRVVDSMHARKQLMADLADAFVALPGGFGTFEELLEIVTWAQLGLHRKPIGLLNVAGYFDPLLELVQRAIAEGFISPEQTRLMCVDEQPRGLLAQLRARLAR